MVWAKQEKCQVYNVVLQPTSSKAHPTCSSCLQGKLVQKAYPKRLTAGYLVI